MDHHLPFSFFANAKPCLTPSSMALRRTSLRPGNDCGGGKGAIALRCLIGSVTSVQAAELGLLPTESILVKA